VNTPSNEGIGIGTAELLHLNRGREQCLQVQDLKDHPARMLLSLQPLFINLLLSSSPLTALARFRFSSITVASEPDKNPRDAAAGTGNPSAAHLPGETHGEARSARPTSSVVSPTMEPQIFVADGLVSVPFGGHNERAEYRLLGVFEWGESKTLQGSKFLGAIANLLDDRNFGFLLLLLLLLLLFLLFFFEGGRLAILKVFLLGGSFLFPRWDPSHPRVSITRGQLLRFKEGEVIRHMPTSLEMTLARCTAHLLAHAIDDPFLSEIGYPPHRSEKEERGGAHAAKHLEEKKREWDEVRRLKIGGIRRLLRCRWVLYDVHYRNESTLAAERVQDGFVHKVFNAATVNGRVEWWVVSCGP
jgi:hypothetical protein